MTGTPPPRILFTAFEPSGDALAAPVIAGLIASRPDLEIHAMGGPRMQSAGAQMLETTTEQAAMLLGALTHLRLHRQRLKRLARWLADHRVSALVPVDSPAANWSVCRLVRQTDPRAHIIHLAAPQLWAWAPWRIGKLRRLTDQVLCLLPFEPEWFTKRRVPAVFVGHPVFDPVQRASPPAPVDPLPPGRPRIAMLPGSRPGEVRANWPTMRRAFDRLVQSHPNLCGVVAASDQATARSIQQSIDRDRDVPPRPDTLIVMTGRTDTVLAWADIAMVVSGTVTLQCAAHRRPMVVLYNVSRWAWQLWGRWLVRTRTFALPNLITQALGQQAAVPELVPHFGHVPPVADAVDRLIRDATARDRQLIAFDHIAQQFADRHFAANCTQQLLQRLADAKPG